MPDEIELIGGVEKRDIVIVAYDPGWPARFLVERRRIVEALGPTARRVDHVGSTSVPGLAAKPIVDIDVSVPDPDRELDYLPALTRAGYRLRVRQSGHRMVRTAALDVHVHICGEGSAWERRHLLFRDWLRRDPPDRAAYAALKGELGPDGLNWLGIERAALRTRTRSILPVRRARATISPTHAGRPGGTALITRRRARCPRRS